MSDFLSVTLSTSSVPWLLAIGLPLFAAAALMSGLAGRWIRLLAAWAALPALGLALFARGEVQMDVPWLLLGARFGIDETSRVFLLFTAILWLAAGLYGRGYFVDDPRRDRVLVFMLAAMAGNLGLVLSLDMVSFYCCYALMSLASYGVIVHSREESALRAGKVYLTMAVAGEVLVFSAMVLVASQAQSIYFNQTSVAVAGSPLHDWIVALTLAGFGIKVGAIPLHMWLPLAHPAAPTPASAVLSGAMINAGLLGWLRLLPIGEIEMSFWGNLCVAAGLTAAYSGVIAGLSQTNAKTVLAYSSISQMGLITIGVGAGLLAPQNWPLASAAVLLYALHHALAKGALFLGVGVAPSATGGGWRRYGVLAGLVIPALALAGVPLTSGAVAKTALKTAIRESPGVWPEVLAVLLPLAAVGTTLLMARFLYVVWPSAGIARQRVDARMSVPWLVLIGAGMITVWVWPALVGRSFFVDSLTPNKIWLAFWPVVVGAAIALVAAWFWGQHKSGFMPEIPPGDLLLLIEFVTGKVWNSVRMSAIRVSPMVGACTSLATARRPQLAAGFRRLGRVGLVIERWGPATALMLALAAALYIASAS